MVYTATVSVLVSCQCGHSVFRLPSGAVDGEMAPLRLDENGQAVLDVYVATLCVGVTLILLIIICGCSRKKKLDKQGKEKLSSDPPAVTDAASEPEAKEEAAGKSSSGKSGRNSEKPNTKPQLQTEKEQKKAIGDRPVKESKAAPSVNGPPIAVSKIAPKVISAKKKAVIAKKAVAKNKTVVVQTALVEKKPVAGKETITKKIKFLPLKTVGPATTAPPETQTPAVPVSSQPAAPESSEVPIPAEVTSAPAVATAKASLVSSTPVPTTPVSSVPAPEEKEGEVEFLEIAASGTGTVATSTITPRRAGTAIQAKSELTKPKVPKGEHVRYDDPAYRSLFGLDDAFAGTDVPKEAGSDRLMGTSMLPAFTARSVTNVRSQYVGSTNDGKKKGKKKKDAKSKTKTKRK